MTGKAHEIPPILRAHYRGVRPRSGMGCAWALRLFILPHTLVAIGCLIAMPAVVAWALFGHDHAAQVERLWTSQGSKGTTHSNVAYAYTLADGPRRGQSTVSRERYEQLLAAVPARRTVVVHALGVPPIFYDRVAENPAEVWKHVGFVWLFGLFWCGIVSLFAVAVYIAPWFERRLYRRGLPITGTLISKRTREGKGTTYYLRYTFTPPGGQPVEKEMTTTADRWKSAEPDQPVTVLYHPDKPKRSVLYDYGGYECVPA